MVRIARWIALVAAGAAAGAGFALAARGPAERASPADRLALCLGARCVRPRRARAHEDQAEGDDGEGGDA